MKKIAVVIIIALLLNGCHSNALLTDSGSISQQVESIITESSEPSGGAAFVERSYNAASVEENTPSVQSETVSSSEPVVSSESESNTTPSVIEGRNDSSSEKNTTQKNDDSVTFKITDSNGKPIPNVYININPNTRAGRTTRYSNQEGIITCNFSKVGVGKHIIAIKEEYKIKKEIRYEVNIEKLPAEVNLIWDFGNPDEMEYIPEATATLYFQYSDGTPVTGYLVCAAYNTSDGVNLGLEILQEVDTLNDKGAAVWIDPFKNVKVELQIVDKDNNLRLYYLTVTGESYNTDYYFSWDDAVIKD